MYFRSSGGQKRCDKLEQQSKESSWIRVKSGTYWNSLFPMNSFCNKWYVEEGQLDRNIWLEKTVDKKDNRILVELSLECVCVCFCL